MMKDWIRIKYYFWIVQNFKYKPWFAWNRFIFDLKFLFRN